MSRELLSFHVVIFVAVQAYECLAILEGTSSMAQQALESNAKLKRDDSRNISAYFNKVQPPIYF